MRSRIFLPLLASILLLCAAPAVAQDEDPYLQPDDTWISLSGTVTSTTPDTFLLDYGDGLVTVEMDDWDWDADAYKLLPGDRVTVYGVVDDDLFETTTIEASSVYVEGLGTHFYASAADEENGVYEPGYVTGLPVVVSSTTIRGTVVDVDELQDEFTVDAGLNDITVDVDEMLYDPLDDEGYQKIEEGDRVSVTGQMETEFFEGRELVADSVVTLSEAIDIED